MEKKMFLGKGRISSTRMTAEMTQVERAEGKRERSLFRKGCNCWWCASVRRVQFHEADRQLGEAAASGDEEWYDQVLKQRVAILQ